MSDLRREIEQQKRTEQLYRDNETTLLNQIRQINTEIDGVNTKERADLQKLEQVGLKQRDRLQQQQDQLQKKMTELQEQLHKLQNTTVSNVEKAQHGYTRKRESLTRQKVSKEKELATTRVNLNRETDSIREKEKRQSRERESQSQNQGRQNNLR